MDGWSVGEVWVVYEAYEVKKRGENYAVFYFAGKRIFFFYIYEVFTWENLKKRTTFHYSQEVI